MRILLAGEASGTHRNLRKGLEARGHDVELLTHFAFDRADESDIRLDVPGTGLVASAKRHLVPLAKLAALHQYDVISLCNAITLLPGALTRHAYADLPVLRSKTNVLSYFAVGCDEISLIAEHANQLPYTPCATCRQFDSGGRHCLQHLQPFHEQATRLARRHFDCVASMAVEYDHSSKIVSSDRFFRIGLPVDTPSIPFRPAKTSGRLVIAHTPTRRGFKGTEQVLDGIRKLATRRSDFEFVLLEGLRHQDYIARVGEADIVIDQVFSQSAGMNALECMAMGKLVLTGSTPLGRAYLSPTTPSPALDAPPEPSELAQVLSEILDEWPRFWARAHQGRRFVEQEHGLDKIASDFERAWRTALQRPTATPR